MAYARLSTASSNLSRYEQADHYMREAFARRDRVSEIERLYIDARHCGVVPEPAACARGVYALWKRMYPRDSTPFVNLCDADLGDGQFEMALANCLQALQLNPDQVFSYFDLAEAYIVLRRLEEAQRTLEQAFARNLDDPDLHLYLYRVAIARGDAAVASAQRAWAVGKPNEVSFRLVDAENLASAGRMSAARDLFARAEYVGTDPALKLRVQARLAWVEAAVGNAARARETLARIDASQHSIFLVDAVNAAALVNERARAEAFAAAVPKTAPVIAQNMIANALVLLQVQSGNRTAVDAVRPFTKSELMAVGPALRPIYLRGTLWLRARAAQQAIEEFQRILDYPQTAAESPIHALARADMARAYVLVGDRQKARQLYQDFFARWKDADPDVPALVQAKAEYARLSAER
jgi:tetratricopeptide (TPR) repeat protein